MRVKRSGGGEVTSEAPMPGISSDDALRASCIRKQNTAVLGFEAYELKKKRNIMRNGYEYFRLHSHVTVLYCSEMK